ncbi:MAG: rhodanese-like domain-containing protein [Hyphomicrobium sp.]
MPIKSLKELVAQASQSIETLSASDAASLSGKPGVLFIDVREFEELQKTGKISGALHVPRGVLESQIDPSSPAHKPELGSSSKLVLYCATGGRSALAAKTLKDMGVENAAHVSGGFSALQAAGLPVEK